MKKLLLFQLISLLTTSFAQSSTLAEKWAEKKAEINSGASLTMKLGIIDATKEFHFFFVPGVLNEWANFQEVRYFTSFRTILDRCGATHSMYRSPSRNSISTNATALYHEIMDAFKQYKKPIVLIGHSKGGIELLTVLMEHPELIHYGIVDRFVSIQGAIGGSPLANSNSLSCSILNRQYREGLDSLKPKRALQNIEQALSQFHKKLRMEADSPEFARALENFKQRIFYVRSAVRPDQLSWSISGVRKAVKGLRGNRHDVYRNGSCLSDGLVLVEDQLFTVNGKPFGIDLGILEADHTGLTVRTFGNVRSLERKAFSVALLEFLFESRH